MKIRCITLCCVFAVITMATATAQGPQGGTASREEMKKLAFLLGKWKGEGTMMTGPGAKHAAIVNEEITPKLDGLVLMIEGKGIDKTSPPDAPRIVHQAFATLSYDVSAKKFVMRAYLRDGRYVNADATVNEKGALIWGFELPGIGKVRYTIEINAKGQWHEVGEFSRDGATWMQNFEMTLDKVSG